MIYSTPWNLQSCFLFWFKRNEEQMHTQLHTFWNRNDIVGPLNSRKKFASWTQLLNYCLFQIHGNSRKHSITRLCLKSRSCAEKYYIWTLSVPALNCDSLIFNVNAISRKSSICLQLIIMKHVYVRLYHVWNHDVGLLRGFYIWTLSMPLKLL